MKDNRAPFILWSEAIRKQARGLEAFYLGRVRQIAPHYVKTSKGLLRRTTYYVPRDFAEAYDGSVLWFRLTPEQAETFRTPRPPTEDEAEDLSVRQPPRVPEGWADLRD